MIIKNESAIDRLQSSNEKTIGEIRTDYGGLRTDFEKLRTDIGRGINKLLIVLVIMYLSGSDSLKSVHYRQKFA